jgi:hypothetical protein
MSNFGGFSDLQAENTRLRAELAQYQRESADENECTKHPGAILAYGCSHCHADFKAELAAATERGRAHREALVQIAGGLDNHWCRELARKALALQPPATP